MKKLLILALLASGLHAQCNLKRTGSERDQHTIQSCLQKEANEIAQKRLRMEQDRNSILEDILKELKDK